MQTMAEYDNNRARQRIGEIFLSWLPLTRELAAQQTEGEKTYEIT